MKVKQKTQKKVKQKGDCKKCSLNIQLFPGKRHKTKKKTKQQLDALAYKYCLSTKNHIEQVYQNPNIYDYPAVVVVACHKSGKGKMVKKESGSFVKSSYSRLIPMMNAIGGLGNHAGKHTPCDYCNNIIIGRCAEQHAGEMVLRRNMSYQPTDVVFSQSYRPRTKQPIKYCCICKCLFGL